MYRFNGFTEKANCALNLAIESAEEMGHNYVGSEHIVLGLLREETGVAAAVLGQLGVTAQDMKKQMMQKIGSGIKTDLTVADFTPRSKRIIQLAVMEAARLNHNYVGTEHLLIALLSESDCYGMRFLSLLGARPSEIARKIGEGNCKRWFCLCRFAGRKPNDAKIQKK